jgi:formate/nitrite transporter FocA (FNT family)
MNIIALNADLPNRDPESSHPPEASENTGSDRFERIDWDAAAPSWASIIAGIALPILAIIALSIAIDVVLCRTFRHLIASLNMPLWLIEAIAFPIVLICVVVVGGLSLRILRR